MSQSVRPKAYGIDVGKKAIHISTANEGKPRAFPIVKVDMTHPKWYDHLPIESPAFIVFEPTGIHYLKPIVTACAYRGIEAVFWIVNNNVTQHIREAFVSKAKTDNLDSQALALIARNILEDNIPIGARPYHFHEDEIINGLRLLLNERERLVRENTRTLNRIDQLAHGIFPICAVKKDTYLNCARHGFITPEEIHHLATMPRDQRPPDLHGTAYPSIRNLAKELPREIQVQSITRDIIANLCATLNRLESEIGEYADKITATLETYFPRITELWRTVPNIHNIAIGAYLVASGARFESYKQFQNCLGVAPTTIQSGNVEGTKKPRGYRLAKRLIHMQTFGMLNRDNAITRYFGGGKEKGGRSFGSAKRKLAGILFAIIKNDQPYEER